ncbi:MAG: DUF4493 domain-containing protein [Muribaculaceae bacterium]|nr:DUF4493 domain-containing protein [Muribaculaceae bacterium]
MKKNMIYGLLWSAAMVASLASCSDDYNPASSTTGGIRPIVDLDTKAISAKDTGRAGSAQSITVNDLSLRLESADGLTNQTWQSVSDFDFDQEFRIGQYTLDAYYGSIDKEGFESPYYFGTSSFLVKEGKYTPVTVDVKLANSMVTIHYTEAFQNYFSSYSMKVKSAGNSDYHEYVASETRPLYVKPGEVTIFADVTKQNGVSATLEAAKFTAKPRYHHTVTIDVNGGSVGEAQMVITFDETLAEETVEIDLSDDLMSSPAPTVMTDGFDADNEYSVIGGTTPDFSPRITIVAQAGISSVVLTTSSTALKELGWPDEIDLCKANAAQQAKLNQLGLNVRGLYGNVDKMAQVDFSKVFEHIDYLDYSTNDVKFTLLAKDQLGKVSDDVSLKVKVLPIELNMSTVSQVKIGDDKVTFELSSNGENLKDNLKVQYNNEYGTWNEAEIVSINAVSRASDNYSVTVKVPVDLDPIVLRAVMGSAISNETTIERAKPDFSLAVNENNVFATYGKVAVVNKAGQAVSLPSDVTIQLSTDGGKTFAATSATSVTGGANLALTPNTSYVARLAQNGLISKTVEFKTENDKPLDNGTFDTDTWTITKENKHDNHRYAVNGWATLNEKTTSQDGAGYGYITTSGTKPDNGTALIRTVGWGSGNTASSNAFNQKSFGTCKHLTPGQLFLGELSSDYIPVYGISFPSRPKSLTFSYKYATAYNNDNGDYGVAEIKVIDATGNVISSKSVQLNRRDSFKEETLELSYPDNASKAASISIVFKSSEWSEDDTSKLNATYVKPPKPLNLGAEEYVGSQLWIDNVKLNY